MVIGILIALQINNWNESRKQSTSEKEFISSVKNDLKQDKVFIQSIVELIESHVLLCKWLLRIGRSPNYRTKID